MSTASSLPTVPLREPTSLPSYFEEPEGLTLPFEERLQEGLLTEPNRDIVTQTQTFDQRSTFDVNGGSATLTVSLGQPMFLLPHLRPAKEVFNVLQKWEGFVIEVRLDTFLARLTRIVGEGPDQEAEIYLSEVEAEDRVLVEPGAVFYWSIGYLDRPSGRIRASIIRFRRLPAWTQRQLEAARAEAAKLRDLLHGDQSS